MIVGHICKRHGYVAGATCEKCYTESDSIDAPAIHTDDWIKGWWNDIAPTPIYIESKRQLFEECEKRGNLPKAFMKPRSQGPGWELKRR